jgi:predicted nucleic acid-binding Zn ribbon protein
MSRRGWSRKFRRVGSVLPQVLKGLKLDKLMAAQPAVTLWPKVAGPKIAEHTRAVGVDGKTLVVVVDSPAWIAQLRFLKPQLLRKVAGHVGKGLVGDIRFVLGQGPERRESGVGNREPEDRRQRRERA